MKVQTQILKFKFFLASVDTKIFRKWRHLVSHSVNSLNFRSSEFVDYAVIIFVKKWSYWSLIWVKLLKILKCLDTGYKSDVGGKDIFNSDQLASPLCGRTERKHTKTRQEQYCLSNSGPKADSSGLTMHFGIMLIICIHNVIYFAARIITCRSTKGFNIVH